MDFTAMGRQELLDLIQRQTKELETITADVRNLRANLREAEAQRRSDERVRDSLGEAALTLRRALVQRDNLLLENHARIEKLRDAARNVIAFDNGCGEESEMSECLQELKKLI